MRRRRDVIAEAVCGKDFRELAGGSVGRTVQTNIHVTYQNDGVAESGQAV
jgi:hypothetical protein